MYKQLFFWLSSACSFLLDSVQVSSALTYIRHTFHVREKKKEHRHPHLRNVFIEHLRSNTCLIGIRRL